MKAKDVILQLRSKLPKITDLFTDKVLIDSITSSGLLATAITSTEHGRTTGDLVNVEGTKNAISITSISRVGTIATVVTALPHDITENYQGEIELINSNEPEFNGIFKISEVLNRLTFTIIVEDSGATSSTGLPLVLNADSYGYNGFYIVTVIDTTTLTFQLQRQINQPAFGTGYLFSGHRITGAVDIETFEAAYTKQVQDKYYACVVLGDVIASKDRHINDDSTHNRGTGQALLQKLQEPFAIYVFVPTKTEIAALNARDMMSDVCLMLMKSIVGVRFETYLTSSKEFMASFVSHSFYKYESAYYVHEFLFEQTAQHTYGDSVGEDFNVAFRDIDLGIDLIFRV